MGNSTAYIGLGSNMGRRVDALERALWKLNNLKASLLTSVSSLYETSPVGLEGRPFINAVAAIKSPLVPRELLRELMGIEADMGRSREPGKTSSRIIDLDLLLYGDTVAEEEDLALPHPRMLTRRFVMEPLAEIAPELIIPAAGISAAEAAAQLAINCPEQEIRRLGTLGEMKGKFEV